MMDGDKHSFFFLLFKLIYKFIKTKNLKAFLYFWLWA